MNVLESAVGRFLVGPGSSWTRISILDLGPDRNPSWGSPGLGVGVKFWFSCSLFSEKHSSFIGLCFASPSQYRRRTQEGWPHKRGIRDKALFLCPINLFLAKISGLLGFPSDGNCQCFGTLQQKYTKSIWEKDLAWNQAACQRSTCSQAQNTGPRVFCTRHSGSEKGVGWKSFSLKH